MISINKRLVTLFIIELLFFGILFRFFQLQVIDYEKFKDRAINKVIRIIPISAPRGLIKDRNNLIIVNNANSYDFQLVPYDVRDNFNYKLLLNYINVDTVAIKEKISSYKNSFDRKFTPISLKNKISQDIVFKIREQKEEFPGLVIREVFIRDYLHNSNINLAHVIGVVKVQNKTSFDPRKDKISLEPEGGIEKFYNQKLKGIPGREYHLFDAAGMDREIYSGDLYNHIEATEGEDINLTIDIELQEFIYQTMQDFEKERHDGTIILSNPETGEVLAYVNSPTFNIEKMLIGISHSELDLLNKSLNTPFFNRGINPYPSGSIMKIPSSIMLLEEGFDENTLYECNGKFVTHKKDTLNPDSKERAKYCWDNHKDSVNLKTAISKSCNVYFWRSVKYHYKSIYKDKWNDWTNRLGFSNVTNIDLLYEKKASLDSHLAKSHMINKSIGQGESKVTPIQVIQMINIIANNGFLIRPHLNKDLSIYKQNIGLQKSTLTFIQEAMKDAVEAGTAQGSNIENVVIRAKTGTAELGKYKDMNNNGKGGKGERYHKDFNDNGKIDEGEMLQEPQYMNAWYAGYMEYGENKKVSIVIFLEESADREQRGGRWASRMAKKIFKKYLEIERLKSE